jgi:hypothetical protein
MKTCPNCKRSIEDDSVHCGYCGKKLPYAPEEEKDGEATAQCEAGGDSEAAKKAPPACWRCEKCGEELEASFDTCWKCGAVKTPGDESQAAGEENAAEPLLRVLGLDKRLEVYGEKVLVAPSAAPGLSGQATDVPPREIPIKDILSIELSSPKDSGPGCLKVNYTATTPDDKQNPVSLSETVFFDSGADAEMAKALELIKQCRTDLDSQAGDEDR